MANFVSVVIQNFIMGCFKIIVSDKEKACAQLWHHQIGNPTMNKAIFETELDSAATNRDLFSVVKGTDDSEQHIREKMVIADMKDDYSIMKNAIYRLEEMDAELLLHYIRMEKTIQEIADELQMNYSSAKKKLQRLRREVIIDAAENIRCRCARKERRLSENESI